MVWLVSRFNSVLVPAIALGPGRVLPTTHPGCITSTMLTLDIMEFCELRD